MSNGAQYLPMGEARTSRNVNTSQYVTAHHDCPTTTTTVTSTQTNRDGSFVITTTTTVQPRSRPNRSPSTPGFPQTNSCPRARRSGAPEPQQFGDMTMADVRQNTVDVYTILYSTNRQDGEAAVWLEGVTTQDGDTEVEPPWSRYTAEEARGADFTDLGMRGLDETTASNVVKLATTVVRSDEGMNRLIVAVLLMTEEAETELNHRLRERGVDVVWYDQESVEAKVDEFVDEDVRREIARGFGLL